MRLPFIHLKPVSVYWKQTDITILWVLVTTTFSLSIATKLMQRGNKQFCYKDKSPKRILAHTLSNFQVGLCFGRCRFWDEHHHWHYLHILLQTNGYKRKSEAALNNTVDTVLSCERYERGYINALGMRGQRSPTAKSVKI